MARRVPAAGRRPGPVVVSVGNLALGGTGKTPVVAALARIWPAAGWQGAVLTRGLRFALGRPSEGRRRDMTGRGRSPPAWPLPLLPRVAGHPGPATDSGSGLPDGNGIPNWNRAVEDGHQTAHLGRHLDVVILDAGRDAGADGPRSRPVTGPVFPSGPGGNRPRGADRAAIWLLETDQECRRWGRGPGGGHFSARDRLALRAGSTAGQLPAASGPLLSGIARPEALRKRP